MLCRKQPRLCRPNGGPLPLKTSCNPLFWEPTESLESLSPLRSIARSIVGSGLKGAYIDNGGFGVRLESRARRSD